MTKEQHKQLWKEAYDLGFEHGKTEGRYEKFCEWDDYYNPKKIIDEKEYNHKDICKYCDNKSEPDVDYCANCSPYLKDNNNKKKNEKVGNIRI